MIQLIDEETLRQEYGKYWTRLMKKGCPENNIISFVKWKEYQLKAAEVEQIQKDKEEERTLRRQLAQKASRQFRRRLDEIESKKSREKK